MENIDTKKPNLDIINKDCRDMTDDDKLYLVMLFKEIDKINERRARVGKWINLFIFGLLILWAVYLTIEYLFFTT